MKLADITVTDLPRDIRRDLPDGARLVVTPQLTQFVANAIRATQRGMITAADGMAGAGKSVSVAMAQVVLSHRFETIRMPIGERPRSPRATIAEFHRQVSGDATYPAGTQVTLERQLERMLAGEPYAVCIDEAQKAGIAALEAMRSMHGHPDAHWGLILTGAGLERALQGQALQMLLSRVRRGRMLRFTTMTVTDVLTHMPQFHPVWETTDEWLLRRLDRVEGRGNWRNWAAITDEVVEMWDGQSPLDEDTAYRAIYRHRGGADISDWDAPEDREVAA